jgi:hypothetical protein
MHGKAAAMTANYAHTGVVAVDVRMIKKKSGEI